MRNIGDFKNNALKVERVPKTIENLNSFETMLKMLKQCKYIYKKSIFWVFVVFRYFWISLKIYQNMGKKLGSNRCPLFTMLTKQNSSMFSIVSFVKKTCLFVFLTCSISTHLKNLFFFLNVSFSFPSPFFFFFLSFSLLLFLLLFFVNLRSHLAIPFNQNQYL